MSTTKNAIASTSNFFKRNAKVLAGAAVGVSLLGAGVAVLVVSRGKAGGELIEAAGEAVTAAV